MATAPTLERLAKAPAVRNVGRTGLAAFSRATAAARVLPDFVLVGCQRCGTTSLHNYLVASPGVVGPRRGRKGVHYFSLNYFRGPAWYRSYFPTVAYRRYVKRRYGVDLLVGESAPYYIFHPSAPERMAELMPDVKLVVMVRDPVERAHSQYQHELARGYEDLRSFEAAIEAEPERLAGEAEKMIADPRYESPHHEHHSYLAKGRYAEQLEHLYGLFPADNVLVVQSEAFYANPAAELERVRRHLGIPRHTLPAYPRYNGYVYASMPAATRRKLAEYFAEPNERLYALLGRRFDWSR